MRLSALSRALSEAWEAGRYADVEATIDTMWPDAPPHVRTQLLSARVALYDNTDRPEQADAARAALAEQKAATP